jgi:hypothetical protein
MFAEGNSVVISAHHSLACGIAAVAYGQSSNAVATFRNNMVYGLDANAPAMGLHAQSGTAGPFSAVMESNTVFAHSSQAGQYGVLCSTRTDDLDVSFDLISRNNVVIASGGGFGKTHSQTGSGTLTENLDHAYGVSSDATAADWGATGSEINCTATECVVSSDDLTPLAGGVLEDTGENRYDAGNTTDALGNERPRVGPFSRGAISRYVPGTGLHRFYRGDSAGAIDYTTPIAELRETAASLVIPDIDLTDHVPIWLGVRNVSAWGTEETNTHIVTRVGLDESHAMIGDPLDAPLEVTADAADSGSFTVGFSYRPPTGYAWPEAFEIITDHGTGTLDTTTPVASVAADRGVGDYERCVTPATLPARYAVRAVSAGATGPLSATITLPAGVSRTLAQPELL